MRWGRLSSGGRRQSSCRCSHPSCRSCQATVAEQLRRLTRRMQGLPGLCQLGQPAVMVACRGRARHDKTRTASMLTLRQAVLEPWVPGWPCSPAAVPAAAAAPAVATAAPVVSAPSPAIATSLVAKAPTPAQLSTWGPCCTDPNASLAQEGSISSWLAWLATGLQRFPCWHWPSTSSWLCACPAQHRAVQARIHPGCAAGLAYHPSLPCPTPWSWAQRCRRVAMAAAWPVRCQACRLCSVPCKLPQGSNSRNAARQTSARCAPKPCSLH